MTTKRKPTVSGLLESNRDAFTDQAEALVVLATIPRWDTDAGLVARCERLVAAMDTSAATRQAQSDACSAAGIDARDLDNPKIRQRVASEALNAAHDARAAHKRALFDVRMAHQALGGEVTRALGSSEALEAMLVLVDEAQTALDAARTIIREATGTLALVQGLVPATARDPRVAQAAQSASNALQYGSEVDNALALAAAIVAVVEAQDPSVLETVG